MTTVKQIINNHFPNKKITYRLSDLIDQLRDDDSKSEYIYIAIEKINRSREFSYLTVNELITIYQHCPPLQRNIYEVIFPKEIVKTYIDFEYYTNYNLDIQNHCIPPAICLKIIYFILNPLNLTQNQHDNYIGAALEQFLLLEATTTEKISYHFIHANPSILFENNTTLGLFIKTFFHLLLSSIIQHKCSIFNIDFKLKKSTINELITVLSPHINNLRTHCTKCTLAINNINISEIAQLLVLNKQKQYTLAIDLNIYNKNQQFRLFESVKKGKTNIFIPSINFPYNSLSKSSYEEILKNSIITYKKKNCTLPIMSFENNQFKLKLHNTNNLYLSPEYDTEIFNSINQHLKFFSTLHTTTK